jgi:hypothetical protein
MSMEIDWEGLVVGFESRSQKITHFFDRQTGDVVQVLLRETERHAAFSGDPRYVALPRDRGERSRGDLEEFLAQCLDEACREALAAALASADPAAAYRAALLRFPREEARFFQFKERRARERALEWVKEQGVGK